MACVIPYGPGDSQAGARSQGPQTLPACSRRMNSVPRCRRAFALHVLIHSAADQTSFSAGYKQNRRLLQQPRNQQGTDGPWLGPQSVTTSYRRGSGAQATAQVSRVAALEGAGLCSVWRGPSPIAGPVGPHSQAQEPFLCCWGCPLAVLRAQRPPFSPRPS